MKQKKWIHRLLWFCMVCISGYLVAQIYTGIRQHLPDYGKTLLKQVYSHVEEAAINCYSPGLLYVEGKSTPMVQEALQQLWEWPLLTYLRKTASPKPIIEDESTLHELTEVNAQTITDRLLIENQEQAVTLENQISKITPTPPEPEPTIQEEPPVITPTQEPQSTLPTWANVTEVTPLIDLAPEHLQDFQYLLTSFFVVDPNTTINNTQMSFSDLLNKNLELEKGGDHPQILIYHTHSQEGYADSIPGDENTSVIGVGNYLTSILEDVYGYKVLHLKDTFDIAEGNLDRSKAYNYALPVLEQTLAEHPDIQVVIDLHRDGVPDDKHLVTEINGKPTAQIMYFNGLSHTVNNGDLASLPNPYIMDNLSLSFQLSYQAAKYYPRFTRCIYLKGYRYNLHVRPRSLLLEVGAQTNTFQEAVNAMEPFAVVLNKVLQGQ